MKMEDSGHHVSQYVPFLGMEEEAIQSFFWGEGGSICPVGESYATLALIA